MRMARQPKSLRRSLRGFTLIEVLVTMSLMAVVLPVAMRGISIALNSAGAARHRVEAATLGQAKLNEIVALANIQQDYSQLGGSGDFGEAYQSYTWQMVTSDDANLGVTNVTMTVSWIERGGRASLDLSTMVPLLQ